MSSIGPGLRLELRRGIGKWLFAPLVALGVFGAEHEIPAGTAIWPLIVSALSTGVELMGPVAAGAAAFAGSRSRRRRTDTMELLSSRSPFAAGLAELGALLAWVVGAFVAVLAVVFIPAAMSATWSGPDPGRTLAAALGLLLEASVGFVAGRVVPRRFTPLVVAVAFYALVAYNASIRSGFQWSLLTPVNLQKYDQFSRLNHTVPVGQILWYLGLGVLAVSMWALLRARSSTVVLTAAVGLVLSVCGGAVLVAQDGRSNEPGVSVAWACRGTAPQVCIHPSLVGARTRLNVAFAPIVHRLRGTPFEINRIEQRPRGIGSVPTPGAVAFALDDSSTAAVQLAAQQLAVNSLGFADSCFTDSGPKRGYDFAQLVGSWVAGDATLFTPATGAEATARTLFTRLTEQQKRTWFATHASAIRGCTLSPADFR